MQGDPFAQLGLEWEQKREKLNQVAREELARASKLKREAQAAKAKRRDQMAQSGHHSDLFVKRPDSAERKRKRQEDYKNALEAQLAEKPSMHGMLRYRPAIGPNGATTACFGGVLLFAGTLFSIIQPDDLTAPRTTEPEVLRKF